MSRIGSKLNLVVKVIKKPRNMREISHYLKNDFDTFRGRYHYKHPIIFIAGLPKSGTTWLRIMLANLPGYNIRPVYDPKGIANQNNICKDVFEALPKNRYSIIKVHTKFSEENFKIITTYVGRFIVTYRDLRDMCVSRYLHIKNEETHPLHKAYNMWDTDTGIMHSIQFVSEQHVPWVENWLKAAGDHPGKILMIQYEQLNQALRETLERIFKFYELDVDPAVIGKMLETQLRKEVDIQKTVKGIDGRIGRLKSTARKGIVGDWKNYFNDEHKKRFKELIGESLIRWGYEKGFNW